MLKIPPGLRIMGLDLSIAGTGICVPDPDRGFRAWTIRLDANLGDHRLGIIRRTIRAHAPGIDFAVIEDLPRNAMNALPSAMAQGVARDELIECGVPFVKVVPSTLKLYATGHGKADKRAMVAAMRKLTSIKPDTHNAADAFWLWHAGMDRVGRPYGPHPGALRMRLDVVDWTPVQDVIDAAIMAQERAQSFGSLSAEGS